MNSDHGTEILIRLWGEEHDQKELQAQALENVLSLVRRGYTSGYSGGSYWEIRPVKEVPNAIR